MSIISLPITLGRGKRKLRVVQDKPTSIDNDSYVGNKCCSGSRPAFGERLPWSRRCPLHNIYIIGNF